MVCHPCVDLVGAVDPDKEARDRFASVYKLPVWSDLASVEQVHGPTTFDLVVVAVPPKHQPALVEDLLDCFNPRLLLLEKPVSIDASGAQRVRLVAARSSNLRVAVNYIRRYVPSVLKLQKQLLLGELGELLHGRIVYGKGLLTNASHFVNLAEAWLGPLHLNGQIVLGAPFADYDYETNLTLEPEMHPGALLHVCSIGASGLRAGELDLWFNGGRLCWLNDGQSLCLWKPSHAPPGDSYRPLKVVPQQFATGMDHYQHFVLDSLVRHLQDPSQTPIHCDLEAGLQTLNLLAGAF